MNFGDDEKHIAARVVEVNQAALDVYLDHRREKLRDRMEQKSDPLELAKLQGALAELRDLKGLVDAAQKSLSS